MRVESFIEDIKIHATRESVRVDSDGYSDTDSCMSDASSDDEIIIKYEHYDLFHNYNVEIAQEIKLESTDNKINNLLNIRINRYDNQMLDLTDLKIIKTFLLQLKNIVFLQIFGLNGLNRKLIYESNSSNPKNTIMYSTFDTFLFF